MSVFCSHRKARPPCVRRRDKSRRMRHGARVTNNQMWKPAWFRRAFAEMHKSIRGKHIMVSLFPTLHLPWVPGGGPEHGPKLTLAETKVTELKFKLDEEKVTCTRARARAQTHAHTLTLTHTRTHTGQKREAVAKRRRAQGVEAAPKIRQADGPREPAVCQGPRKHGRRRGRRGPEHGESVRAPAGMAKGSHPSWMDTPGEFPLRSRGNKCTPARQSQPDSHTTHTTPTPHRQRQPHRHDTGNDTDTNTTRAGECCSRGQSTGTGRHSCQRRPGQRSGGEVGGHEGGA